MWGIFAGQPSGTRDVRDQYVNVSPSDSTQYGGKLIKAPRNTNGIRDIPQPVYVNTDNIIILLKRRSISFYIIKLHTDVSHGISLPQRLLLIVLEIPCRHDGGLFIIWPADSHQSHVQLLCKTQRLRQALLLHKLFPYLLPRYPGRRVQRHKCTA